MKTEDTDRLKSLFQEMKLDEPSIGFENRLMQKIEYAQANKIKCNAQKNNLKAALAIACGIIILIGLPILIIILLYYLSGNQISMDSFLSSLSFIKFNPPIISVFAVILLLLMSDTLIRKRIWHKKHKE